MCAAQCLVLSVSFGEKCGDSCSVSQGCKNVGLQATQANNFCIWASNICEYSVGNWLYGTHVAAGILRWFRVVLKICAPLE
jgi:hypothetical protein